jgi:hypothetical protein
MRTNKEECSKIGMVTEKFEESEPAVTCMRCGAKAHDPAFLCSPSVTVASSTKVRDTEKK